LPPFFRLPVFPFFHVFVLFEVQLTAIQCNLVQSTAISRDGLQSVCGGIAPSFGELRQVVSLCRLGNGAGRRFDPQVSL
jgi:hypothetical protein